MTISQPTRWDISNRKLVVIRDSIQSIPLGPAYDLTLTEVRNESVVVEWQKPVYTGSGPITGYHVEYSKTGSSEWITANETAVSHRFYKVRELCKSFFYVFLFVCSISLEPSIKFVYCLLYRLHLLLFFSGEAFNSLAK